MWVSKVLLHQTPQPCLYGYDLICCWNRKSPSPNGVHKNETLISNQIPSSLLHYILQLAQHSETGYVLLTSIKPWHVHQTARQRSVFHHSTEQGCTAPESSGSVLYATPSDAWHCTCWCKACMLLPGHKNPFHEAHSFCAKVMPGEVWNFKMALVTYILWALQPKSFFVCFQWHTFQFLVFYSMQSDHTHHMVRCMV